MLDKIIQNERQQNSGTITIAVLSLLQLYIALNE